MTSKTKRTSPGLPSTEPLPGRPEKIAELIHDSAFHTKLRDADIIFGSDEATGNTFLMYGKRLLERIIWTNKSEVTNIATVPILQATTELEAFIAGVTVIKGRCDYNGCDKKSVTIPISKGGVA